MKANIRRILESAIASSQANGIAVSPGEDMESGERRWFAEIASGPYADKPVHGEGSGDTILDAIFDAAINAGIVKIVKGE